MEPSNSFDSVPKDDARAISLGWKSTLRSYRTFLMFVLGCVLFTCAFLIADSATSGDNVWETNTNPELYTRCEQANPGDFLREKWNSLSNFGFVFVGVYFIISGYRDLMHFRVESDAERFYMGNFPFLMFLVGLALVFEGYGSFHMHSCAAKCPYGGFMDIAGIFALIYALLLAGFLMIFITSGIYNPRSGPKPWKVDLFLWISMSGGIYLAATWDDLAESMGMAALKNLMLAIFGVLVAQMACSAIIARVKRIRPNHDYVLIPLSAASVVIAVVAWLPEEVQHFCPETTLQLHAIWHLFLSFGIGFGAAWMRSVGRKEVAQHGIMAFLLLKEQAVLPPVSEEITPEENLPKGGGFAAPMRMLTIV